MVVSLLVGHLRDNVSIYTGNPIITRRSAVPVHTSLRRLFCPLFSTGSPDQGDRYLVLQTPMNLNDSHVGLIRAERFMNL
jgi:hypothetical protein